MALSDQLTLLADRIRQDMAAAGDRLDTIGAGVTANSDRLDTIEAANNSRIIRVGANALENIPDGYDVGGSSVVAIGWKASQSATELKDSVAIGRGAMQDGTATRANVAIGAYALRTATGDTPDYDASRQAGTRNIGIGWNAGYFVNRGIGNIGIGNNAAQSVVDGTGAVAVGQNALAGYGPVGLSGQIENWSPMGSGSRVNTVAVGGDALRATKGLANVAVGGNALKNCKAGDQNVAVGANALTALQNAVGFTGGDKVSKNIDGTYSQTGNKLTMSISAHGAVVGDTAFIKLLSGDSQTLATDDIPATVVTVPDANTFTLNHPKSRTTSGTSRLVYIETAAASTIKGAQNTALGDQAGAAIEKGENNVIVGALAGVTATSAGGSVLIGRSTLGNATVLNNSVAIGYCAGVNMSAAANYATAVGYNAARYAVDGSNHTADWTNITALGNNSRVSGANQLQLGDTNTTVYAQKALSVRSDERDKRDIRPTVLGLEFIDKLEPVDYRLDPREAYDEVADEGTDNEHLERRERDGTKAGTRFHHGLIAQQVAQVADELGVDFAGYQDHSRDGGSDVQTLAYEELIGPLIRSVQQLSARVAELEAQATA